MLKIAFDHQAFTSQSYGGISRYFTRLAEELIKKKQYVKVFAGIHRNHYLSSLPPGIVTGLKVKRSPHSMTIFRYINYFLTALQIEKMNPDVIHETYYSSIELKGRRKKIITVYDMTHELHADFFKKNDHTSKWKKRAINSADHVICISQSTKNDLVKLFEINQEKVSVVHLGVDSWCNIKNINKYEPIDINRPFLLYIGQRGGYKNFSIFLKAISVSKIKKEFDIIAFGGGKFTKKEKNMISDAGFNNQQVRQISGDDYMLAALYRKARALIYPSLYEGFGMPLLEAMACNCPVISSNTSSMPEVIGDAGKFFNPNSIEDMIYTIERVVFSETEIKKLQEKGENRLKFFSWEKCAKETLAVYQKLVG